MLTSKQRSNLRSLASNLKPITQVGKFGVNDTLIKCLSDALEARELIKVTVLENSDLTPKDAGLRVTESGILHALIEDGTVNQYNMKQLDLDLAWLHDKLRERSLTVKQVFFLGIDDIGQLYWIEKEDEQ